MIPFDLVRWSAWAPGLEERAAWVEWAAHPTLPKLDGAPEVRFVPAMARRRLTRIAKMTAQTAFDVATPEELRELPMVFASRHCEIGASARILRDIAADLPLSPTAFSHSVHNAPIGQLSILTGNRRPAVSVAARNATFATGLIEALALSRRLRGAVVLASFADEPLPPEFHSFSDEPDFACSMAMLVSAGGPRVPGALRMNLHFEPKALRAEWPDVLRFLAWIHGDSASVPLCGTLDAGWRVERSI